MNETEQLESVAAPLVSRRSQEAAIAGCAFLGCGAVGVYLTFLAGVALSLGASTLHIRSFAPELWNRPDWRESDSIETHFHSIRQQMVDDLRANHLRVGMTREDVLELIGPGDAYQHFRTPTDDCWIYYLGTDRGFGIDCEWLVVDLKDGVVQSTHLERH
jgi:hypothetical protein